MTTTASSTQNPPQVQPYRIFATEVAAVRQLSPSFRRITFTGPDLDRFADNGYDQRIKLVLPVPGEADGGLPTGAGWYAQWRERPEHRRNAVRTYTVRAVRPQRREVDVDLVLHGATGPASAWAETAVPGCVAGLVGPDRDHPGPHGGVEFRLPGDDRPLLLAGDETAVPAICGILERLPAGARGDALLEVPLAGDALPVRGPLGVRVTWLPRDGAPHGAHLEPAVRAAAQRLAPQPQPAGPDAEPAGSETDDEVLWEVPAAAGPGHLYAWLAGEAGVIRRLRRYLVGERGVHRGSVAFMGYWRIGRAEG